MNDIHPTLPKLDIDAAKAALVQPFIAKNDIRFYLCGLHVQPCAAGGVILTGTDGARLACVHDSTGICDETIIVRFDIPKVQLKAGRRVVLDNNRLVVHASKTERLTQHEVFIQGDNARIDGIYPDVFRILPKQITDLEPGITGGYALDYLLSALNAIGGKPHTSVSFYTDRTNPNPPGEKPVFVLRSGDGLIVCIMSMRDSKPLDAFNWIGAQQQVINTGAEDTPTPTADTVAEVAT